VGGFTAYLGERPLPLSAEDDLAALLEGVCAPATEEMEEGEEEEEQFEETNTKKRKHKRGKKK
jgi:hypothetical protein